MEVFDEGMLFYEKRKLAKPKTKSKPKQKELQKQAPSDFDGAFEFFGIELESDNKLEQSVPKETVKEKPKKKLKIPVVNLKESV